MKRIFTALAVVATLLSAPASALIIKFDDYALAPFSKGNQGVGTGSVNVSTDGSMLELTGNLWRSISVGYNVTSNTLLNFDFFSTAEGEIHGIAFENDNNVSTQLTFQLLGVQSDFGIQAFDNYTVGDGWSSFSINAGSFFTGAFNKLVFVMDDDRTGFPPANAVFRNVEICETGSCLGFAQSSPVTVPSPATLALLGAGLLFISLRRKI